MKLKSMVLGIVLAFGLSSAALAQTEVGNKVCPISGEEIGGMGKVVQVEYNGKLYNLCCAMCKKNFLADPEKFSAIAEENAASAPEGAGHMDGMMEGEHNMMEHGSH